jgi:hypothetical protein
MVKSYSLARDGNTQIAKNFKVREFACKDGSDYILIDDKLVHILQDIRDHFGVPVIINSGYRNAAYNKKIGGAKYSQHIYGKAADIVINFVTPEEVASYADSKCIGGVGLYKTFTHVDSRSGRSRWDDRSWYTKYPATFIPAPDVGTGKAIQYEERGKRVVWLQAMLNKHSYGLVVDGIFGAATLDAVRRFQKAKKLAVDGLVGNKTKAKL